MTTPRANCIGMTSVQDLVNAIQQLAVPAWANLFTTADSLRHHPRWKLSTFHLLNNLLAVSAAWLLIDPEWQLLPALAIAVILALGTVASSTPGIGLSRHFFDATTFMLLHLPMLYLYWNRGFAERVCIACMAVLWLVGTYAVPIRDLAQNPLVVDRWILRPNQRPWTYHGQQQRLGLYFHFRAFIEVLYSALMIHVVPLGGTLLTCYCIGHLVRIVHWFRSTVAQTEVGDMGAQTTIFDGVRRVFRSVVDVRAFMISGVSRSARCSTRSCRYHRA